jgi:hypothetical protein
VKIFAPSIIVVLTLLTSSCATVGTQPTSGVQAVVDRGPDAISGNSGAFMSPFTSDDVTAEWVTKAMTVQMGGQLGSMVGQQAGQELLKSIPFIGGSLGKRTGRAIGARVALDAIGGEAFLKSSSDQSFNTLEDMAKHLRGRHSAHPEFQKILTAINGIYPGFNDVYARLS